MVVRAAGDRLTDNAESPWLLVSNFTSEKKGDEELPDYILRDQAPVAKRLMESQGLKEWKE